MSNNRRDISLILIAALVVIVLVGSLIYELKYVADADWKTDYKFESKEPNGMHLFKSMLISYYGKENVLIKNADTNFKNFKGDSTLYIYVSNEYYLQNNHVDSILQFLQYNNNALIIAPLNSLDLNEESVYKKEEDVGLKEILIEDTIHVQATKTYVDTLYFDSYSQRDSTTKFKYSNSSADKDSLIYRSKTKYGKPKIKHIRYLDKDECSRDIEFLSTHSDSLSFYGRTQVNNGYCYVHLLPQLFTNISSQQEFYLDNFNTIFQPFNPKTVILDHPSYDDNILDRIDESPLGFIMSQPALRWAYFVLIAGMFSYLILGGKRKQKAIPIIQRQENTSLEYVEMISELYRNQNQHEKLVKHFEDQFYHTIQLKYFIDRNDKNFVSKLSKKSQIEDEQINRLLNKFKSAETSEFNGDHLAVLYKQIDKFYKNCK